MGASVIVVGTTFGAMTDRDGKYLILSLPAATYSLRVSAIGYISIDCNVVTMKVGDTVVANVAILQIVTSLAPSPISGRYNDSVQLDTIDGIVFRRNDYRLKADPKSKHAVYLYSLPKTSADISGIVVDHETGRPIVGASVAIVGTTKGAQTDLEGKFDVFKIPVGVYSIRVTTMEYYKVEINSVNVSELHTPYPRIELVKNPHANDRTGDIRIPEDPYWPDMTKHSINNQYGVIDPLQWPDRDDSMGTITGVIIDSATGDPIMGVAVSIKDDTVGVVTNSKGEYQLGEISPGTYSLKIFSIKHVTTIAQNVKVEMGMATRFDCAMRFTNPELARMLFVPAEVDTVDAGSIK